MTTAVMEFQEFPNSMPFDALPDGSGFLVSTPNRAPESASIAVVLNWASPLKK